MDVEGHEKFLLAQNCDWLNSVDAIGVEYHYHDGDAELARVANRYGFLAPQRLAGEGFGF